jgi:hypothetical protein
MLRTWLHGLQVIFGHGHCDDFAPLHRSPSRGALFLAAAGPALTPPPADLKPAGVFRAAGSAALHRRQKMLASSGNGPVRIFTPSTSDGVCDGWVQIMRKPGVSKARSQGSRYSGCFFWRFFFIATGIAGRVLASSASLASLKARRRCMFLRTAMACCSISVIARAPSSVKIRCRSARAMLTGEGSADFLAAICPSRFAIDEGPLNPRGSSGQHRHFCTSVKWPQASDRFSALAFPRILSVLMSKVTFWPSARPERPARSTALM